MAKIYAIAVRSGRMTIESVPERWRAEAATIYKQMYGDDLQWT